MDVIKNLKFNKTDALRLLIVGGVAVVIFGGGLFFKDNQATLIIYLDDMNKRTFQGPIVDNMTIAQALYSSSMGGGFELSYVVDKDGKTNNLVIDGIKADKGWNFFVNKKPIQVEYINSMLLKSGDIIEVKTK